MRIFWASPLIQNPPPGRPYWMPKIEYILGTQQADSYKLAWTTTDAIRANKWAVGAANLTLAQLALIQGDNEIRIVTEPDWLRTFNQLPAQVRTRVNAFCDQIGVVRPANNEVLRDLFQRLVAVIESLKSIEGILTEAESK